MRKLIICMDGTGNEIGDRESNVAKIYRTLVQDDDQLAHYVMGVGTDDAPTLFGSTLNRAKGVLGLAFGLGLEDDVLDVYRWLSRTYCSAKTRRRAWLKAHGTTQGMPDFHDDQIYVLGFSRGAYAARVLAGFINVFGVVPERNLHLVAPVFRAYRGIGYWDRMNEAASKRFRALRHYRAALTPEAAPVRALLLFDTVASMIRVSRPDLAIRRYWSLVDLGLHEGVQENPSVRIVIQALAVDERRTFFRPLRWTEGQSYFGNRFRRANQERRQYVRQRWFPGYHGDIGGSVREDEAGIGQITALWILKALQEEEAKADAEDRAIDDAQRAKTGLPQAADIAALRPGLRLRRFGKELFFYGVRPNMVTNAARLPYAAPDPLAPLHHSIFRRGWRPSLAWSWLILEVLPPKAWIRRAGGPISWFRYAWPYYLPLLEPRYIPDEHEVDHSVFIRRADPHAGYAPVNLTRTEPETLIRWWALESE